MTDPYVFTDGDGGKLIIESYDQAGGCVMTPVEEITGAAETLRTTAAAGELAALCSPALAELWAASLDAVAQREEALSSAANADIAGLGLHPFGYDSALAIARVINGTTEAAS